MAGKIIAGSTRTAKCQHTTPCSDCPWRRDSIPGWLGGYTPEEFVRLGHNDQTYNCHVITNQQCAGLAIYRANVVKRADPPNLRLPADTVKVFSFGEFLMHHMKGLFK